MLAQLAEKIGNVTLRGRVTETQLQAMKPLTGGQWVDLPPLAEQIRLSLMQVPRRRPLTLEDCMWAYEASASLYSAVRWISDAILETTFHTYSSRGSRDFPEISDDNPIRKMFSYCNADMDEIELWDFTAMGLLLQGTVHYVFDVDEGAPNGVGIYPVATQYMEPQPAGYGLAGWWLKYPRIDPVPIPKEQVLTFKMPSLGDPFKGVPPVMAIHMAIDSDISAQNYNNQFFKTGGRVEAVIEQDEAKGATYNEEQLDAWTRKVRERYAGTKKSHKVLVLEPGMLWKNIGISMRDAEYVSQRKMSKEDIASAYHLHPVLLGAESSVDIEKAEAVAWRSAVIKLLERIESKITHQLLLTGKMANRKLTAHFDTSNVLALQRDDFEITKVDVAAIQSGRDTINERRALRGKSPVAWGNRPPPSWYGGKGASNSNAAAGSEGGRDQTDGSEPGLIDQTGQR